MTKTKKRSLAINMFESPVLFSTAYFPPIHYFARVNSHKTVYIERFEHFNKQTYRNRCTILGANGPLNLVVPVVKGRTKKIVIKDIRIAHDEDWQRNHWRSIFSAYNSSPFFEFYKDEIFQFFEKKWKYLFDFNTEIHNTFCELLDIDTNLLFTEDFEKVPAGTLNLRSVLSPKIRETKDVLFHLEPYTQVFSEKIAFVPNLSIIDLLFNEGPNSFSVLEASLKTD